MWGVVYSCQKDFYQASNGQKEAEGRNLQPTPKGKKQGALVLQWYPDE